jgi:hypothetical protein
MRSGLVRLLLGVMLMLVVSQWVDAGLFVTYLNMNANGEDELLTDYSWGLSPTIADGALKKGDIIYGLARLHDVNGYVPIQNGEPNWRTRAWIAFAFQITRITPDWIYHGPVPVGSGYSLNELLGVDVGSGAGAMLTLIELADTSGGLAASQYLTNAQFESGDLISAMTGLKGMFSSNQATWLASYGKNGGLRISTTFVPDGVGQVKSSEYFKLPLVAVGPGAGSWTASLLALDKDITVWAQVDANGMTGLFKDSGIIVLRAVPEPSSVLGLLTLSLSAGGLGFLRRRRK